MKQIKVDKYDNKQYVTLIYNILPKSGFTGALKYLQDEEAYIFFNGIQHDSASYQVENKFSSQLVFDEFIVDVMK